MMDDFSSMRYAHSDGHTDICFDESGTNLFTCGTDGDVRIWNGFDDDDPQSQNLGKFASAIAFKNKMLYVANDSFSVSAYTFPDIEFDSIIAQYNSTVYHIVCNNEGNLIASGGGDFIIKVYDNLNKNLTAYRGHDGPVLSLAFDTKDKYLASTGCDGTLRIWQLSDEKCVKTLNILKKSNDKSLTSSLNRLDWSPDGQLLAVPVENEIRFYTRDLWECALTLKEDSIVQSTTIAAFSPFGNYIAVATLDGQIVVWDVEKKSCVSKKSHEKKIAICGVAWNPSGKDIVFCDIEGQLGIHEKPLASSQKLDPKIDRKDIPIDFECEDDGEKDFDDDANDLDFLHDKDDEENENAFDIGAIKAKLEPQIFGTDDDDAVENESVRSEKQEPKIQIIEAPKPLVQTAFQPSSTPVHLERRFMLWNTVGIVRCYNTEEENSIDVEFHDANVYHPLHLNNTRNHTLAALSTEALILACPKSDENTSKLECLHFGTWDSNKEWIVEMPENEDIESIAVGDGFAVCITDKRFLRIFTISGVQGEIISIPGPVVCSAAREKQIVVAYHRGLGFENDQCINVMVIDVRLGKHCTIKDFSLPLSPKSFLTWLGYSDEGHPCMSDSSGIVNMLNPRFGLKWTPVANTKSNLKGLSDTYFVLGLSEIKQEIRCILCKGSRYPQLLPVPTVMVIPFSLPFCEMSSDKGRLEEENVRCLMTHKRLEGLLKEGFDLDSEYNSVEKKWMDILLKMFALATRTDREYRALDIAQLMPNTVVLQAAIKYATQRHRLAVAERVGEVMSKKLLAVEEDEEEPEMEMSSYHDSFSSSQDMSYSKSIRSRQTGENNTILKPKALNYSKSDSPRLSGNSESLISDIRSNSEKLESSLTPKSSSLSNPFKATPKQKPIVKDANPSSIDNLLDNSTKNLHNKSSSTPTTTKAFTKTKSQDQKNEKQTKLNTFQTEAQPKKFGFPLFLEQNRDSIVCSSESELSESEIIRTAMKMYKELPESEKQKYAEKNDKEPVPSEANGAPSDEANETISETDENQAMNISPPVNGNLLKRKETTEVEDDTPKTKKLKNKNPDGEESAPKPKKLKNSATKVADTTVRKLTQFAFTKSKASK